ncbi:hypothetical protein PENSPDRAFT_683666 [Peniophora sp. CONT]|nr:hypothetical protein PENSPDRAFT_683666 [Peniophora sp. CONT]
MSWIDPVAHLEDPDGLQPNSAGFTESPHIWFKDGTVVLICSDHPELIMGFRVNESILSLNSTIFKDMFAMKQPVDSGDTFEGCPIVHLQDDPFAMNNVLRMLYERSYARNLHDFTLREIEGILQLATKYLIYHIRIEVVEHLERLFPSTLLGYRMNLSHTPYDECFLGLKIALRFDLPALIPCALYLCSLHEESEDDDEEQDISNGLRWVDLEAQTQNVLSFRDALRAHIAHDVRTSDWFPIERSCVKLPARAGCNGIDPKTAERIRAAYLDSAVDVFVTDPLTKLRDKTEPECCVACFRERQRVEEEAYKPILWNLLPVFAQKGWGWTGWTQVEQARRDARKTWAYIPPDGPGDGYY